MHLARPDPKFDQMNKKLAHTLAIPFDLFCLAFVWIGFSIFKGVIVKIADQVDFISFNSRASFFIAGIGFPVIHLIGIIEYFKPGFIKKHARKFNCSLIGFAIVLIAACIIGSSWIKSKVEDAGYVYCREASGVSALARSLVYAKDMETCEELAQSKSYARK